MPEYDAPLDAYPRFVRAKEFDYGVYAFTAPGSQPAGGFDLDIGVRDDLHVLRFHAKEKADGRTVRWTRATSYVSITDFTPNLREVTLWMNNGGRPAAARRQR